MADADRPTSSVHFKTSHRRPQINQATDLPLWCFAKIKRTFPLSLESRISSNIVTKYTKITGIAFRKLFDSPCWFGRKKKKKGYINIYIYKECVMGWRKIRIAWHVEWNYERQRRERKIRWYGSIGFLGGPDLATERHEMPIRGYFDRCRNECSSRTNQGMGDFQILRRSKKRRRRACRRLAQ